MLRLMQLYESFWRSASRASTSSFIRSTVLAIFFAFVIVAAIRIYDLQHLQARLGEIEAQIIIVQSELRLQQAEQNSRLNTLEKEVFGVSPLPAPPVYIDTGPLAWQRNRDQELRRRIHALEEWRMQLEGRYK